MSLPPPITIRLGQLEDIQHLRDVELSAAGIFTSISSLAHHASDGGLSTEALTGFINAEQLWDACVKPNIPVGFIVVHPLSSSAYYIAELSVAASHQRLGIGRALVEAVCADVAEKGIKDLVLTTYRDVTWNGPWYRKQGFAEIEELEWEKEEWGSTLKKIVDGERGSGESIDFGGASRCVMRKIL